MIRSFGHGRGTEVRKDKPVLDRYEAGKDVPISEMAGAVVVNGVVGIVKGVIGATVGLIGFLLLCYLLLPQKKTAEERSPTPESNSVLSVEAAGPSAAGSEKIAAVEFTSTRGRCGAGDEALAQSVWEVAQGALSASSNPHLLNFSVAQAKLADGEGKIVSLRYAFAPGDPDVESISTQNYLVAPDCRLLPWGPVVDGD